MLNKAEQCSQNPTLKTLKHSQRLSIIDRIFSISEWNYHQIFCQHRSTCSRYCTVCFMAAAGVQSSTQSPLLGELGCLTGAREAQGSVIDLTSQSCRAPSPSFTPPAFQPHTMCTETHSWTHTRRLGVCERTETLNVGSAPCYFTLYVSVFHVYMWASTELHTDCPCVTLPYLHTILAALKS